MKKKRPWLAYFLIANVFIFLVICLPLYLTHQIHARFFTDISDFSKLEPYVVRELSISEDRYVDENTVKESYIKTIKYGGRKYDVFAYVFENTADAAEYYSKCSRNSADSNWGHYSMSNFFFTSDFIAFHENCLFRVAGGSYLPFSDVVNFICKDFEISEDSLQITDTAQWR